MDWGDLFTKTASGAATGSAFGPWGTAIGGGVGALSSLFGGNASQKAMDESQKGWNEAKGFQDPFRQGGVDQYGRLNDATGRLLDPASLQNEWSKNYETSPYAKQLLSQNQSSGLDAASSMGLMGSSAALGNIQQGAGNIVQKDRQQYMDDLMKKYMTGIGLGENLYGTGAGTAANEGSQAMEEGTNMANLAFKKSNDMWGDIAKAGGSLVDAYQNNPDFTKNWKGFLS